MLSKRYQLLMFAGTVRVLGFFEALKHEYKSRYGKKNYKVKPKGYRFPVYLRSKTSDYYAFFQVITSKGYKLDFPLETKTIIDCGANIGLTTVYFKNIYPDARIIAVEPEKSNFALLQKNTALYSGTTCLCKGIWNKSCFLRLVDESAEKWAFRVEETTKNADIQAISINDIVKRFDLKSIDILKMDIEGSEKQIFSDSFHEWLPLVKVLMIELHDSSNPGCSMALFKALEGFDFSTDLQDETLVIKFNHIPK